MTNKLVPGSCFCGAVQFTIELPTLFCGHCHCSMCRRPHGAAFVTWVGFRKELLKFASGEDVLRRYRTETDATRTFCSRCGTTLFYEGPRWPEEIHVARAGIRGALDREPAAHFYVDHAAAWWRIDDSLTRYGGPDGCQKKG